MKNKDIIYYNKQYSKKFNMLTSWNEKAFTLLKKQNLKHKIILDCGCGKGILLKKLIAESNINKKNIYAVDQSDITIKKLKTEGISNAKSSSLDKLPYKNSKIDIILLMEVIEHLRNKDKSIEEINRVLKKDGILIISFPNYLNFPWLIVRILSEFLNKPEWIHLQPCDKIYNYFQIKKYLLTKGFKFINSHGTNYYPPLLYKYEPMWVSDILSKFNLAWVSFHPILIFKKN